MIHRQRIHIVATIATIVLLLSNIAVVVVYASAASSTTIIDRMGKVTIPSSSTTDESKNKGVVTVITSPNIPSIILPNLQQNEDSLLSVYTTTNDNTNVLICQGATLTLPTQLTISEESDDEETEDDDINSSRIPSKLSSCLYACASISDVLIVEGISLQECTTSSSGILDTRHAITFTSLFTTQIHEQEGKKQTIIIPVAVSTDSNPNSSIDETNIKKDLQFLYQSSTMNIDSTTNKNIPKFDDIYTVQIIPIVQSTSESDTSKVLVDAITLANELSSDSTDVPSSSFSSIVVEAIRIVRESKSSSSTILDIPSHIQAMATINTAYVQLLRTMRVKVMQWKNRISRGLVNDQFGTDASTIRQRILSAYDTATIGTIGASSLSIVQYRYNVRKQLQSYIDTSIQQAFKGQVTNLEKSTIKRFNSELLQSLDVSSTSTNKESIETVMGNNAATMRKEALLFEKCMDDMEVPALGLVKDSALRDIATKLNTSLMNFPDSPAAKLKRYQQVTKVVNKEKRPGQRSINFGIDLVAMLRPDGFGSLQGFAGYQLPGGNSITFGIHNDADDPQVIAQFGGVRPPLLRVQPKLRVDVEM